MHRQQPSIISSPALILEGLRLLWHRDIRWLVIIPLLINIVLFAGATGFAAQWLGGWLETVTNLVPDWLHWLVWIFLGLFGDLCLHLHSGCQSDWLTVLRPDRGKNYTDDGRQSNMPRA